MDRPHSRTGATILSNNDNNTPLPLPLLLDNQWTQWHTRTRLRRSSRSNMPTPTPVHLHLHLQPVPPLPDMNPRLRQQSDVYAPSASDLLMSVKFVILTADENQERKSQ
jgi:hypothetical protein